MTGPIVVKDGPSAGNFGPPGGRSAGPVAPMPGTTNEDGVTNIPVQINIGNLSQNSGIYVGGRVTIFGLSSHMKTNTGFGSIGSKNLLYRNVSFVYDPDAIDTPIDDRDVHVLQQAPGSNQSATNIGVGSVYVNTLQQNAGTFFGTTTVTGMDSHEKQNLGHGQVYGNWNLEYGGLSLTQDQDIWDAIMNDQDYKAGVFFSG